jgi:hypothetical protein
MGLSSWSKAISCGAMHAMGMAVAKSAGQIVEQK